jgi:predicted ATPase with chaperone activity
MHIAEVRQICALGETGQTLMKTVMNQVQLSARAYHHILKLARTMHSTMSLTWRIRPMKP